MKKEKEIKRVTELLTIWVTRIQMENCIDFLDINKVSEDLSVKLLNGIYGYKLRNLNADKRHHSAVDLGERGGIAVQVTSRTDSTKIKKNVATFKAQHKETYPGGIRFLILSPEESLIAKLRNNKDLADPDINFQPSMHILSVENMVQDVSELYYKDYDGFRGVLGVLEQEMGRETGSGKKGTTMLTKPPASKTVFLGRDGELGQLKEMLGGSKPVVLVNGLGGIGKTELCKRYFWAHYEDYDYAAWVDYLGSVRESLVAALEKNPQEGVTLEEAYKQVVRGLLDLCRDSDLLLVVDNIEDPDDGDLDLLLSLRGTVLVSSRLRMEGFECMPLGFLDAGDCRALFYKFYTRDRDDGSVGQLIELCGGHTLTVELLARTARNADMTAAELLGLLRKEGFDLRGVVTEGVKTNWHDVNTRQHFYDHLETLFDISGLSEDEVYVAMNLAVLPTQFIERRDVKELLGLDSLDAVNELVFKGWLQEGDGGVRMHQVVREVMRGKRVPDAEKCGRLINELKKKLYLEPSENPLDKQEWVVLADEVLKYITDDDEDLASLANNLSLIYKDLGQTEKALKFQLKDKDILEKILDKNHPSLATSYNNLSAIYKDLGQTEKALEFQLKALDIRVAVLDKNHPDLAQSYNNLSMIYQDLGQTEKALEFQLKATNIREQILDQNHPSLATSYNNLSAIYKDLSQMEKALEFQLKATKIYEAILNKNHPLIATSYNNFSLIFKDLGQTKKALKFQLKATKIYEAVLDKNHPLIATSYNNLSMIYKDLGQTKKALKFQLKTTGIFEQILDQNHPSLATSYNNLSTIYLALSNLPLAAEYSRKAVDILRRLFPNGHPNLTIFEKNLAIIEAEIKKR